MEGSFGGVQYRAPYGANKKRPPKVNINALYKWRNLEWCCNNTVVDGEFLSVCAEGEGGGGDGVCVARIMYIIHCVMYRVLVLFVFVFVFGKICHAE